MTTQRDTTAASVGASPRSAAPWFSLLVIVLAQLQMAMNISVLPVSLRPIGRNWVLRKRSNASGSRRQRGDYTAPFGRGGHGQGCFLLYSWVTTKAMAGYSTVDVPS